jgi:hypothetical protein
MEKSWTWLFSWGLEKESESLAFDGLTAYVLADVDRDELRRGLARVLGVVALDLRA